MTFWFVAFNVNKDRENAVVALNGDDFLISEVTRALSTTYKGVTINQFQRIGVKTYKESAGWKLNLTGQEIENGGPTYWFASYTIKNDSGYSVGQGVCAFMSFFEYFLIGSATKEIEDSRQCPAYITSFQQIPRETYDEYVSSAAAESFTRPKAEKG